MEVHAEQARPCPFCGNDYVLMTEELKLDHYRPHIVLVLECRVCNTQMLGQIIEDISTKATNKAKKDLIKKWNKRSDR